MRKIVGLDIGVSSVGFAVAEASDKKESIDLLASGVRIITEDPNFHGRFYTGNSASKNADRTTKRSIRRLNNRYKNRRAELIETLSLAGMMPDEDLLYRATSLELYFLRENAIKSKISLNELGRIFYHLNQKRGFLSNRKSQTEEENNSEYLQKIKDLEIKVKDTTIGSYFYHQLCNNPLTRIKENIFPRKEYIREFDIIWNKQKEFYPELLTGGLGENNKGTLYQRIRNEIIYYQRPLKSVKHLVSNCRFEPLKKVSPKSSPLFQVFRIWQQLNNLEAKSPANEIYKPDTAQRIILFDALHSQKELSARNTLTKAKILRLLELPKDYFLNYDEIEGNKTFLTLYNALRSANVEKADDYLFYSPLAPQEEKGGLWQLWHITYSLPNERDVVTALQKHFQFTEEQATIIASRTGYTADFGSLSARAIKKLLPHLHDGLHYDKACKEVGYDHVDDIGLDQERALLDKLEVLKPNTLRNPVVEQILNQVVNVMNTIIEKYGRPDEIRVELARELKNNAKQRQRITKQNKDLNKKNDDIRLRLVKEHGFKRVNARDLLRYRLWQETEHICLYSGKPIKFSDLFNGKTEIEHILPKSRSFSNNMSNYIVAYETENTLKGQRTAYDYMKSKGEKALKDFVDRVNHLHDEDRISKSKRDILLCPGEEIPNDFLERQLKDTQYISREAVKMLKKIAPKVTTTTGSVTDYLRDKWKLSHLMEEINIDKYRAVNQTERRTIKDQQGNEKEIETIVNFSKRDDHRHHAIDAIIVALTSQSIIQRLNNLNKEFHTYAALKENPLNFPEPMKDTRNKVKMHLENTLISFKKPSSKVVSKKKNRIKTKNGIKVQETWAPRGSLHEDTVMGQIKRYKKVPIDKKFNSIELVINEELKAALFERIKQHNNDPKKAFDKLSKNPIIFNGLEITEVLVWDRRYTKRVVISEHITSAQISKIVDKKVKELLESRIEEAGSIKEAFKEYRTNPLFLDSARTLPIRNVTVFDEGNLQQVRDGFVYTKGNHHAIIYTDGNGNFKEKVVPFWYAVEQCLLNLKTAGSIYPTIDKSPSEEGWKFYTSLQINDLFVLDLDPNEIDFTAQKNRSLIAKNLYRVQKISKGDYVFRHQYETTLERNEPFALRRLRSAKELQKATKVRLNHLGEIIEVENNK
ncbi:MAG TPA: type II CRISPR RNA-guided endonuclease Cas9 [Chitinophagaceae bacterium]|nr:type II CRISPR RNA-guided endonuclease Cas9 [Chitinophagaceae bacterium]